MVGLGRVPPFETSSGEPSRKRSLHILQVWFTGQVEGVQPVDLDQQKAKQSDGLEPGGLVVGWFPIKEPGVQYHPPIPTTN